MTIEERLTKTIIFLLFICFCVIFSSFAGVTYLDKEPVVATGNQTNALKPWEVYARAKTNRNSDIPKWEDCVPVEDVATNSTNPYADILDPIPPPITNNNFKIVFPKLYTCDNYLVMTNAQYSGRDRRQLAFSEFTATGCRSLYFDVTQIHPIILNYLNLSKDRVILEDKEMTRRQLREATYKIDGARRKLEGQIRAMALMMDATDQLDAIDAASDTRDTILDIIEASEPTFKKMIETDMDEEEAKNTIETAIKTKQAAFDLMNRATDMMRGMIQTQKKELTNTRKQRELISYQEFLRGQTDQETIKKSRPTSMDVNSTEEYYDNRGNRRLTVPKSSTVNFNYDQ